MQLMNKTRIIAVTLIPVDLTSFTYLLPTGAMA